MYSTHNEEKLVVAERVIRTLKNKIHKYTTSVSQNVYIDKLDDMVNKYNKTNLSKNTADVNSNTYIDSKFKTGDIITHQIGLEKFL